MNGEMYLPDISTKMLVTVKNAKKTTYNTVRHLLLILNSMEYLQLGIYLYQYTQAYKEKLARSVLLVLRQRLDMEIFLSSNLLGAIGNIQINNKECEIF